MRIQQSFTSKFLLLCFHAVHWSWPLPAPQSGSGLTPRGNVLLRHKFQLQWGNAHAAPWAPVVSPFPYCHSSISFFLQCSQDLLGPMESYVLSLPNLARNLLPSLRLWLHICFNLTEVQDAACCCQSCLIPLHPCHLSRVADGLWGWSPGQVGRGWRNRSFPAWGREGQGRDCTCWLLPQNGLC